MNLHHNLTTIAVVLGQLTIISCSCHFTFCWWLSYYYRLAVKAADVKQTTVFELTQICLLVEQFLPRGERAF